MKTYIQSAIVCIFFAFIAQSSFAQAKEVPVNGTVVADADNTPLPGANVTIAGTPMGIVTDAEGKFSFPLGIKPGDKLVISFIGFVTQTYAVAAEANENITIRMTSDNILIEELASNEHFSLKTRRGVLAVFKRKH
jgi:hypothetical protein